MSKWKKNGKRILVLLLATAIIGGMTERSRVTVAAADAEGEAVETESRPEEEALETQNDPAEKGASDTDCDPAAEGAEAADAENTPVAEGEPGAEGDLPAGDAPNAEEDTDAENTSKVGGEGTPGTEGDKNTEEDISACSGGNVKPDDGRDMDAVNGTDSDILDTGFLENGPLMEAVPGAEQTEEQDPEVTAVEELLGALPTLEELKELDQEGQMAAYEQIQAAYDAWESLEEEQKALLPEAEALLRELLEYFTELVAPAAADVQGAWDAMTAAMENRDASVDLSGFSIMETDWGSIWPNVAEHNPDLFYMLMATYYKDAQGVIQRVDFTYNPNYNASHVAAYKAAVQHTVNEVIRGSMSDEQKALALHDYLVQHMEYDQNAFNNSGLEKRNAYEALVNGIGVCEGYALAYAALLKAVNIEVDFCESRSMNHIWNYVKLGGNWYHVDPTYDDVMAASQFGATGSAKHEYFLLSDSAMAAKPGRDWETKGVATDTSYDNSWHKTVPSTGSAIYTTDGSEYYLKKETVVNAAHICRGASLVKRTNGTETTVATVDIKNLGAAQGQWPMYGDSYSRLSYTGGILYFNVGNSVYSYHPSAANAVPVEIYEYVSTEGRIVSGLLVSGDEMILETYLSGGTIEKVTLPLFTLKASEQKLKAGYTTPPVLTATAQATSFVWEKQLPDGNWQTISGASGSSYTIEMGLPAGTYNYRVTAELNGKRVTASVAITVTAREEQKNFAFPSGTKAATYGDGDFTITAAGAAAGSSVTYSSSDPSVASVDPVTGAVRILKAGSTVLTATASETEEYLEAKSTCTLTVSPRTLAWDVSALEAKDRLDRIKDQGATLFGELKLSGILEKDTATVRFECLSDCLTGVYEKVAAGSQKVTLSWKNAQDPAVLLGEGSSNYTMPGALPEIMGQISVVESSLPLLPESTDDTSYRLQVEYGISEVPDSFKDKEHLNTPGRIEKEMKLKIQERSSKVAETDIVTYDVDLLINVNGTGWKKATKDNFPSGGLTITLPYPSGTGRDTHDFVVAHMFTEDMNGFRVGDVEHPVVTKTEAGLTFKVYGLSPISIGWKEVERHSGSSSGGGGGNNSTSAAAPASAVSSVNSAPTGDTLPVMGYVLLAAAASALLMVLWFRRKRIYG